jgi:cytochrome oxidase Cu insertion factor (SCO1/SenC/PrrC family)
MLLLLAAVCGLPIVLSYLAYYVWKPTDTMNYGELISPSPVSDAGFVNLDGTPFSIASLRGKWVLLHANQAACDSACRTLLYYMRQARTAQGQERDRIERLWVITDQGTPDEGWLKDYPDMKVVRGQPLLPAAGSMTDHIYLLDPMGALILRYPASPEPKRIIKDLARLMKFSNVDRGVK